MNYYKKTLLSAMLSVFCLGLWAQNAVAPTEGDGSINTPYEIETWQNLYWLSQNDTEWDKHFEQTADIILPADINTWDGDAGWTPIGNGTTPFRGTYDGQNHVIENLFIDRPNDDFQGLFGAMVGINANNIAILRNIRIDGVDITALGRVGSLLGKVDDNHHTLIENCQAVNGTVQGEFTAGGLVGANNGTLTGPPASNQTLLQYCFADIDVIFTGDGTSGIDIKIGGLVGCGQRGTIRNSFALGDVNGINGTHKADRVGGLAGCIDQGSVTNAYALGVVTADNNNTGPLVGRGAGLGAGAGGGITNSFYNVANTDPSFNTLGTAETETNLKDEDTFKNAGWDFDNIWAIDPTVNNGFPYLLSNPPSGTIQQPIVENEFIGTDGSWSTATNWSEGIPTSSSIVTLPANKDVVVDGATTAEVLDLIIRPNASLTIESGGELEVAGNMFIIADENGTGSFIDNGDLTVNGQVFVQKYGPAITYGWTVASPMTGMDTVVFNNSEGVYYYDPLIPDWSDDYSSSDLELMRGYWTKFGSDKVLEFSGGDLHTGSYTFADFYRTVTFGEGNQGWNFIGNPYPSAISWDEVVGLAANGGDYTGFTTATKLNSAVYISDNDGGYLVFNDGAGDTGFEDGIIPPATAFWIQVNRDYGYDDTDPIAGAELTINNSVRVHPENGGTKAAAANILRLRLENDTHTNETIIRLRDGATYAFDPAFDAVKMFSNNPAHPQIYSLIDNDEKLAINAIPEDIDQAAVIRLGYINKQGSSLSITAGNLASFDSNVSIYLEDKFYNHMHDLTAENTYSFTSNGTQDDKRFLLHFVAETMTAGSNADNNLLESTLYIYDNTLYINNVEDKATLSVYNLMGQEVLNVSVNAGQSTQDLNLPAAYYLVKLQGRNNFITEKVLVK